MCDYSIEESVNSREAIVGDNLVSTKFNAHTRGFSGVGEPSVAVCVKPGTEIEFERNVKFYIRNLDYINPMRDLVVSISKKLGLNRKTIKATTAIFRQADRFTDTITPALLKAHQDDSYRHRDALEFPDGTVVLLTNLVPGQRATVLQLPVKETPKVVEETHVGGGCSFVPAPELETIS